MTATTPSSRGGRWLAALTDEAPALPGYPDIEARIEGRTVPVRPFPKQKS